MKIAVLGAGHIGSTVGRLWHAAGHEVTFAAQDATGPRALAAELGERAYAATVPGAVAGADVVLVAIPGSAVADVLTAAGGLDGKVIIDAANMMGADRLTLRQLADAFPRARWVRAFNTLQARVLADENHRKPRWVLFISGLVAVYYVFEHTPARPGKTLPGHSLISGTGGRQSPAEVVSGPDECRAG